LTHMDLDFSVVKNLRKKLGMTADDLAKKAGVSRISVAKIELGNNNPTIGTIKALAYALNLTPSKLIYLLEKPKYENADIRNISVGNLEVVNLSFPGLQIYRVVGAAGDKSVFDLAIHDNTAEIACVLSGKIKLVFAKRSYDLKANMALRFKAIHEHHIHVIEDAEIIMIMHGL